MNWSETFGKRVKEITGIDVRQLQHLAWLHKHAIQEG